ncbi:unnamed protein product [Closterium sp. Naga37s-1]|nr:unnamed protein product [Closterium sp. Naga37s-1]
MTGDDNNSSANGGGGGANGGLLQLVESPIPEQKIFNSLPFPLVLTPRVLPNPASTSAPSAPPASLSANASDASAPASSSSSPQAVSLATSASSPSDAAAPHVSDAVAWIRANREWLLDTWQLHGAVLLRGLPLESPCDFNEVVEAFGLDELPYVGGAAPRTKVAPRVFTANESPPDQKIPFHHEMAQVPEYPTRLFFFCQTPPASGGETPILPSCELTRRLALTHPSFVAQLRAKGLLYVRVLPEEDDPSSAIGRGWKSTFLTQDKEEAQEKAAKLGVKLEWQADGSVRTVSGPIPALRVDTRPLPSVSTKPHAAQNKDQPRDEVRDEQARTGEVGEEEVREAWFNSMVAAYTGWKDVRNDPTKAVTFGDGEALPGEVVLAVEEEMEQLAVAVPWRRGEGEEMREEGDAWGLTDDGGGERGEREGCRRGKDESEAGERDEGGGRSEEREEEGDESEGKLCRGGREEAREGGGGKAESSRRLEVRPEGGQRKDWGAVDEGGLREGEKEREEEREGGGKDAKGFHGGEIRPEGEQWKEEAGVAGEGEVRKEAGDAGEDEAEVEKEKEEEEEEEDEKGKEKDEDKEKEEEKAEEEDKEEEEEEEEEYVYLDLSQAVRRLPRNCRLIIERN